MSFEQIDLSLLNEAGFRTAIFEAASRCQASLDLAEGPLWRVIHFKMPATYGDRVLIVIHHLAVDGVSWRILLEDFESAYNQLKNGQNVRSAGQDQFLPAMGFETYRVLSSPVSFKSSWNTGGV